jgi:hypothetical protein
VQAEATQAVTQFKNFVAVESNAAPSIVERASVVAVQGGTPAPDRHWRPQLIVSRTSRAAIRHRAPMTPQAFMHLPELEGRITPPEASGLRLTDEVLAAWDAQARAQGLPDDWRLPDADVERSRQAVLADIGGEDLWVFGYGS